MWAMSAGMCVQSFVALRCVLAVGIFRELIPASGTRITRVAFRDPPFGSKNRPTIHTSTLQLYTRCSPYTLHVLAYYVPSVRRCVNGDWKTPQTSKACNMEVPWSDIGIGNLQHNSTYVALQ